MVKGNEKKRQKPTLKQTGKRPGIWVTGAGERVLESNQSIAGQMHDEIKGNGDLHFFLYIKSPGVSWEDITPGRMDKDLGQSISRKMRCDGLEGARANMRHHSALLKAGLGGGPRTGRRGGENLFDQGERGLRRSCTTGGFRLRLGR